MPLGADTVVVTPRDDLVGRVVQGSVTRVEEYGLYVSTAHGEVLVLRPDIAARPIADLKAEFPLGTSVSVRILKWVEGQDHFRGSMMSFDGSRE